MQMTPRSSVIHRQLKLTITNLLSENINIELLKISDWIAVNKLSLNAKKSNYMMFHHIRNKRESGTIVNLQINSTKVQRVSDFNFLGVTINEHAGCNEQA